MTVIETDRLTLRRLSTDDQEFILELLNDPAFLRFIGDRGVRTPEDARKYITNGPMDMYARLGFGLFLVELKDGDIPIGLCGLIKRDGLDDVDIGFAFLPEHRNKGYAYEAAAATMTYGKDVLSLERIVAITSPDNEASGRLLEKLGLRFERMIRLSEGAEEVKLFSPDDNLLRQLTTGRSIMSLGRITPILRIFDEARAKEFYVDFLGFKVDWEHRFEPGLPVYMGISKGNCFIHLTEHHGDCSPGAAVRISTDELDAYQQELLAKQYKYARPGIQEQPWGSRDMTIHDPFSNRLTFFTTTIPAA